MIRISKWNYMQTVLKLDFFNLKIYSEHFYVNNIHLCHTLNAQYFLELFYFILFKH